MEGQLQDNSISKETKPISVASGDLSNSKKSLTSSASGNATKCCCKLDVVILAVVLIVIWTLLSLPILFFYIPTGRTMKKSVATNTNQTQAARCPSVVPYSGSVCRDFLHAAYSSCDTPPEQTRILTTVDASVQANQLLSGLQAIASEQCMEVAVPFLCVFLFGGVCDKDGLKYLPTTSECSEISTGPCRVEFELARTSGFPLPECDSFPAVKEKLTCSNRTLELNGVGSGDGDNSDNFLMPMSVGAACPTMCRENFYCDESTSGICVPQCPQWNLYPIKTSKALDYIVLTCSIIGFISAILVIVISIVRYKKVYTFPSVLVIYITVDQLILVLAHIITFIRREDLYCTSRNLADSVLESTTYCIITGVLVHYIFMQFNIWWVAHMATLLWKVSYPEKAKQFHSRNHHKILHLFIVLVAIFAPLIPVVAIIGEDLDKGKGSSKTRPGTLGFGFGVFPPIVCAGLNSKVTFYSLILPCVLLVMAGTSMLAMTIWIIHKKQGIIRSLTSNSSFVVSTAEKKLIIVISYYILLQVVTFAHFSITKQARGQLNQELSEYFLCEQSGFDPASPCSRSGFENLIPPGVAVMSFIIALLIPTVNFVFVIDYSRVKKQFSRWCSGLKSEVHV